VVRALVREGMVYGNKFLWESLIFKKLWSISQGAKWNKQKQTAEKRKLEQMQKPTSVQLDEKVEQLMNKKMDSTIPNEVRNILAGHIKTSSLEKAMRSILKKPMIILKPDMQVDLAIIPEGGKITTKQDEQQCFCCCKHIFRDYWWC
jgi:hypothetical protein